MLSSLKGGGGILSRINRLTRSIFVGGTERPLSRFNIGIKLFSFVFAAQMMIDVQRFDKCYTDGNRSRDPQVLSNNTVCIQENSVFFAIGHP